MELLLELVDFEGRAKLAGETSRPETEMVDPLTAVTLPEAMAKEPAPGKRWLSRLSELDDPPLGARATAGPGAAAGTGSSRHRGRPRDPSRCRWKAGRPCTIPWRRSRSTEMLRAAMVVFD